MISIICVYNNKKILNTCLLKTLKVQTSPYELVLIDNRGGQYCSAASALNKGAQEAKGDLLVFIHQDMLLESSQTLEMIEQYFQQFGDNIVIGPAGKSEKFPNSPITNMKHGIINSCFAGQYSFKKFYEVNTLDECLFAVSATLYRKMALDEKACNGWHLYAVDYCLSVHTVFKTGIYVVDIPVYHYSDAGSMNFSYYPILMNVCKKHLNQYNTIYTTMGNFETRKVGFTVYKQKLKYLIMKSYLAWTGKNLVFHKQKDCVRESI